MSELLSAFMDDSVTQDFSLEGLFNTFWYNQEIKHLNCKMSTHLYSIHDSNNEIVKFSKSPNTCGSPYCLKCAKNRQDRLLEKYLPYIDDKIYPQWWLRHIVATTPTFPRSELPNRITECLENAKKYHEKMRKEKYPFRALCLLELKYTKSDDKYYFHIHYGVMTMVNIKVMRDNWCKVWNQDLVVKFVQDKNGNPVYKTRKYAFLEYATRRRAQQGMVIPPIDYWAYLSKRQMFKRVGFTKLYLATVSIIRKTDKDFNSLPDGWSRVYMGVIDINWDIDKFLEIYKTKFRENCPSSWEVFSLSCVCFQSFTDAVEEYKNEI
jgi:hypothetical protein